MHKYKTVILGAGNMGAFFDTPDSGKVLSHAHAFQRDGRFELLGFYDSDQTKAEKAAALWNCTAYPSLESALAKAEVVCCAVPDDFHYNILKSVLKYLGIKLVFTEKPFTKTLEQAQELKLEFEKSSISCVIDYSRRFLDFYKNLKKESKKWGNFIRGTGYYGKGLIHNGSHMIDLISFLLGVPDKIKAGEKLYDWNEEDPTIDVTLFINGSPIELMGISCETVTIFELELFYEKSRIRILNGGLQAEKYDIEESREFKGYYNYTLKDNITVDYSNSLINATDNIYRILTVGDLPECGIDDGVEVLRICDRLRKACR